MTVAIHRRTAAVITFTSTVLLTASGVGRASPWDTVAPSQLGSETAVQGRSLPAPWTDEPTGEVVAAAPVTGPATGWEGDADSAVIADRAGQSATTLLTWDGAIGEGEVVGEWAGPVAAATRDCPRWTAQIDSMFLWLGNLPGRPLFLDNGSFTPVLAVNQLNPPVSVDPRYALFYHHDACHALEVAYFGVYSFDTQRQAGPFNTQLTMDNLAGLNFDDVDFATASTTAAFKSFEANGRWSDGGFVTWLAGFRWVEWNQTLSLFDQFTDASGLTGYEQLDTRVGNDLYGGQVGYDAMIWNQPRIVSINTVGKAGVYYNQSYQSTNYSGDRIGQLPALSAAQLGSVGFVGEIGANAEVVLTSWLSWRTGYSFFWLAGVATPAAQINTVDVNAPQNVISSYGSVFVHGATTGLEARW